MISFSCCPSRTSGSQMLKYLVIALGLVAACRMSFARPQESPHAVVQSFDVGVADNGERVALLLRLDGRLADAARRRALWGKGDWAFVLPEASEPYRAFESHPPLKAHLSVVRGAATLDDRALDVALASLQSLRGADDGSFLLTQDHSSGAGSYGGLVTTVVRVSNDSIQDVVALDVRTGQVRRIVLAKALKSDWRVSGDGREILSVACRVDEGNGFVVEYAKYSWAGSRWERHARTEKGYWESDQVFPDGSVFP